MTGDERAAMLGEEFPGWVIEHLPEADLPWEGKRHPFKLPPGGGFAWIRADSPERLRDLVGGALQIERQLTADNTEPAYRVTAAAPNLPDGHLHALAQTLGRYDGITTELRDRVLHVTCRAKGGTRTDRITCAPRPDDGGRLWFFDSRRKAVSPAGHPDAALDVARHLRDAS